MLLVTFKKYKNNNYYYMNITGLNIILLYYNLDRVQKLKITF